MTRYKLVNGNRIKFTAAEETARDNVEAAWNDNAFNRAMADLRSIRNNKLKETDWMANSDVTMSSEMTTYRQDLRDITNGLDTVEKVEAVEFPTKPSGE